MVKRTKWSKRSKRAAWLLVLLLTTAAQAQPAPRDRWNDEHQWQHIACEAFVGGAVYALTDDRWIAYGAAAAVGLGREEWKRRHGYANYNASRLVADLIGAVIGVESVRWFKDWRISPHINQGRVDGVFAVYRVEVK